MIGWLCQVFGEPNRAYCRYCRKTLHAHRLSLLKHTATARHENATTTFKKSDNLGNNISEQNLKPFRKKQYNILGDRPFQIISTIKKIEIPQDVVLDKDILEENNESECYTAEIAPEHENDNQSQYLTMEENVDEIVSYNIYEQNVEMEEHSDTSLPPLNSQVSLKNKSKKKNFS